MSGDEGLRALAEGAVGAGDWFRPDWMTQRTDEIVDADDAAFIAAANPTAVLALLDRLAAAEAAVERVRALADEWANQPTDYDEDTEQQITDGRDLRAAIDGTA